MASPASNSASTKACARAVPPGAWRCRSTCACNTRWRTRWRASREEFPARAGGGIVMNVDTGEILAMVSLPDCETGNARQLAPTPAAIAWRRTSTSWARCSRSSPSRWRWRITPSQPRRADSDRQRLQDRPATRSTTPKRCRPICTARDVLAQSSNIGTAQIALRSGADRQQAFLNKLGLLEPVGSQLPERAPPLYPQNWGRSRPPPSASAMAFRSARCLSSRPPPRSSMAGARITPTFLKHPADARGEQLISPADQRHHARASALCRHRRHRQEGRRAGLRCRRQDGIGGESRPARPLRAHKLITSFCAIFPIDNPRYLVFVMLDEPHGTKARLRLCAGRLYGGARWRAA